MGMHAKNTKASSSDSINDTWTVQNYRSNEEHEATSYMWKQKSGELSCAKCAKCNQQGRS